MAVALNVPVFIVITKLDMINGKQFQRVLGLLQRFLVSVGRNLALVSSTETLDRAVSLLATGDAVPVLAISCVSGRGSQLVQRFIHALQPTRQRRTKTETTTTLPSSNSPSVEFQVEDVFQVAGVGTVISGTLTAGTIRLPEQRSLSFFLGPDKRGNYQRVKIRSIHRQRTPVSVISSGQAATLALFDTDRRFVRAGMVLFGVSAYHRLNSSNFCLSPTATAISSLPFGALFEIEARVLVLSMPKPVFPKQNGVLLVGCVKQSATLKQICQVDKSQNTNANDCVFLAEGDEGVVRFRFIIRPEYVKNGARLVYRNGKTKLAGQVIRLLD